MAGPGFKSRSVEYRAQALNCSLIPAQRTEGPLWGTYTPPYLCLPGMQCRVTTTALSQWQMIWIWEATHLQCLPQVYDKDRMLHGVYLRSSISSLFTSLNIVGYDGFTPLYMSIYNTHKYHIHVYPVLVGCSQLDKPFLGLEFLNLKGAWEIICTLQMRTMRFGKRFLCTSPRTSRRILRLRD